MSEFAHLDVDLDMPIRRFVTSRLIGIQNDATIQKAVQRMVEFEISSIAVLDGDDVVGFFTDTDIKKRMVAQGLGPDLPVTKIMTRDLISVEATESVGNVLELMAKHKIKHMLVTKNGQIYGVTALRDLENLERQRLETFIGRE